MKSFLCTLAQTAVIWSSCAADLHKEGSLWQKRWLFASLTSPFKMFFKTICSKWKFWSRIRIMLFIGGRNWKTVWVFLKFIFNFKCCQAHEGVKNWVGHYDRTNPLTSENWMWPKNLLLKQVYFHELAVLFFWAGRTGLIWLHCSPGSEASSHLSCGTAFKQKGTSPFLFSCPY